MKKILVLLLCLVTAVSYGQNVYPATGLPKGSNRFAGELIVDSNLVFPSKADPFSLWPWTPSTRKFGSAWVSRTDSLPYWYNGIIARRPVFFIDTFGRIVSRHYLAVRLTWDSITNKPTVFPVAPHTHPISDVVGLLDSLGNKYTKAQSDLLFVEQTQVGVANGVASLNNAGVVPLSQLPSGLFIYKGTWNVTTNTPTLINGTGTVGDVYVVTNGPASHDFGAGSISFANGDRVSYNGTIWQKWTNSDQVISVNGLQGVVVLTTDDVPEGTNKYYANALVSAYLTNGNGITENAGVLGNDSLRMPGHGLARAASNKNIFVVDSTIYMDYDSIQVWVQEQIDAIPAAQNFANADLTATGDRLHDFNGNFLQIVGLSGTQYNIATEGPFNVFEEGGRSWLTVRAGVSTTIGDVQNNYGGNRIEVNDTGAFVQVAGDSISMQHSTGEQYLMFKPQYYYMGDIAGNNNGSKVLINDAIKHITLQADSVKVRGKTILDIVDTNANASGFNFLVWDNTSKYVQRKGFVPYNFVSGLSAGTGLSYAGGVFANTGVLSINGGTGAITGVLFNNGNSFGAGMTVGTNDNNTLSFETNAVTRLSIGTNGSTVQNASLTAASGTEFGMQLLPTINGSGTQGYTGLDLNVTETATGSGSKRLFNARVGNISRFSIYNTGATEILPAITWSSGTNYALKVNPTFTTSGSAAWNALDIDVSSTGATSGSRQLIHAKHNSVTAFAVDYGGETFIAGRLGLGTTFGTSPSSKVHAIADAGIHAGLFTGSSAVNAVGLGSNTTGGIVQGYQANGALTSNLQIQPIGGRTLFAGMVDNGLEAVQVNGGIYGTALKINTGSQSVGKIWRSNNTNGAGDWSDAYVSSINGSNGAITGVFQQWGNIFGQNIMFGAADNFSVFTVISGVPVGGFSNQLAGSAFLVGTATYDASSAMRLQVNGGIKATAATYSSGGLSYLVRNSGTGNFESVSSFPMNVVKLARRNLADANTTIATSDYLVALTSNTSAHTFTLPLASTMTDQEVVVKDQAGNAATFNLTIVRSGSNTIDGATSQVINTNYGKFTFYSDGTNWFTK